MTKDKLKNIIAKKHAERVAKKEVKASREVIAKQSNVLSQRLAKKLDMRMEKILFDAEELVKKYFPARYVSASLTKLQKQLISEGVSCTFDKSVTKKQSRRQQKAILRLKSATKQLRKLQKLLLQRRKIHWKLAIKQLRILLKSIFRIIEFQRRMLCASMLKAN
jgi:hypothetical protein